MNSNNARLGTSLRSAFRYLLFTTSTAIALHCACGETIFDNSAHDLGRRFDPGVLEIGDEIQVIGTARYVTNFSFEYWGDSARPGAFAGPVEARVRFYRNDGSPSQGFSSPGTLFYDSSWFTIMPTLRNALVFLQGSDFPMGGLFLPVTNFTWTVQFQGLGTGDAAGVDLYSPAVAGFSYPDYWEKDGAAWALKTNSVAPMNFAARVLATHASPPAPSLSMRCTGGQIALSWPATATSFVLETTHDLGPNGNWTRVADPVSVTGPTFTVVCAMGGTGQFFRLRSVIE